ncbi:MAG: sialidase family protein [Thermoanaerobaculia bacterium]|nr:sialidase family protein [Thermoanaerobaculia bacterium]
MRKSLLLLSLLVAGSALPSSAQKIEPARGADPRVDYAALTAIGPWDDRNYKLTQADLALLAPNEAELRDPVPAFFRVQLRRENKDMLRTGPAQYPRSALQIFELMYGGYLVDGKLYKKITYADGRFQVVQDRGISFAEWELLALNGDVRVTSPTGAAESAIKIHPFDTNRVIAGSNGPGSGQIMHYSTDGGSTWTQAGALPLGSTCCDPTVDWSSDGNFAYTSTLGSCSGTGCRIWFYRSNDGGVTWNGLESVTPGNPRRQLTRRGSDKEYLHVDKFATSPHRDNIYLTWHDSNVLKFARSTDFGNTWSAVATISGNGQTGIGSDITSDKNGNVYYFWPAINAKQILVRKSTNGGASFNASVVVGATADGYDFAIPAMETRRAFIYVAADTDVTNGPFANSVYAAWTDATAAETTPASANHGRIRVAYSRDGGATWTVTTPHETADANTVDRFHPWLAVGPDGKVHVIFYDTRRDPSRVAVDIFHAVSSDGGATWATPVRLTSVLSPQIDTGFEWGDYNGLDVIGTQLLGIYTDNRNETGAATDSVDVYAVGKPVP